MKLFEIIKKFPGVDDPENTNVDDPLYRHKQRGNSTEEDELDIARTYNLRTIYMMFGDLFSEIKRPTEVRGNVELEFIDERSLEELEQIALPHMNKIKKIVPGILSWNIEYMHDWTEEQRRKRSQRTLAMRFLRIKIDPQQFGRLGANAFAGSIQRMRDAFDTD